MTTYSQFSPDKDDKYISHLKRLSRKHEAPEIFIRQLLNEHIGSDARLDGRIMRGEANAVYKAKSGNDEFIIRINRREQSRFKTEQWAIETARKQGIPVPEIIATGTKQNAGHYINYSIQKKIEGQLFDELVFIEKIERNRAKKITEQAGELLAYLHKVKMKNWGPVKSPGEGRSTKSFWLQNPIDLTEKLIEKNTSEFISTNQLYKVAELLAKLPIEGPAVLLHHDLGPKHIFVDNSDTICGIIDWEDCEAGRPIEEFIWWRYWFERNLPVEWLKSGYEKALPLTYTEDESKLLELRMLVYNLDYYINAVPLDDCAKKAADRIKVLISDNA